MTDILRSVDLWVRKCVISRTFLLGHRTRFLHALTQFRIAQNYTHLSTQTHKVIIARLDVERCTSRLPFHRPWAQRCNEGAAVTDEVQGTAV